MELMLDQETVGVKPGCVILQTAAVFFDENMNYESYNSYISLDNSMKNGFKPEASAMKFWMKQKKEIADRVWGGSDMLNQTLIELTEFISTRPQTRVWSRGSHFDFPILEYAYEKFFLPIPWHFRKVRDLRSLMDFFNVEQEVNEEAHDALADCNSQIVSARKILKLEMEIKGNVPR
jgi:3' exoribonuclease, RNase T-like